MSQQPKPVPNNTLPIVDLVMIDILNRKADGCKKYGTPLQAFNGRNSLQDAYEEVIDLAIYLRQVIEENNTKNETFNEQMCPIPVCAIDDQYLSAEKETFEVGSTFKKLPEESLGNICRRQHA